jgi:glutathione S-transferase
MQVRIHGFLVSTWTRTACMTCSEKGAEFELVPVPYGGDEHGALHPFRRIPILELDGTLITETLAITAYLDETLPGPALQPTTPLARARMRTWMGICGDYLFREVVRTIPRDREASDDERATARSALERAESLVRGDSFLVDGMLTLADLYLAPQIANCEEKAPELLDGLEALGSWKSLVEDRESFRLTTLTPAG